MMKRFLIFISIVTLVFTVHAQNLQKQAEQAYVKGDYKKAAQQYELILKTNGQSADLYYNLGNCFYKTDQIASAILNYEKALLLEPNNSDIRHNLELAKAKTIDKIIPVGRFLFADWFESFKMLNSSNNWAKSSIVLYLIFIVGLFVYFFSGRIWMKKLAFFGGIFFLFVAIMSGVAAYSQKQKLINEDKAIIFSSSVVVKSTPDDGGTDLFVVHQGTKVSLKDKVGFWSRIQLEDGNDGWIKSENFKIISLLK